ncbi:hypothetical protein OXYTRIMIC_791 [Oxytricha trifallax]|uniref:Uncharacterized protein n=1 Tax=Oxytricha trifallax TaxID=1172189 RepID=A0A073HZN6_9SPIT|nr:hypothetical protein OXYTRIMIC_791 [Oxytricha trifallax]
MSAIKAQQVDMNIAERSHFFAQNQELGALKVTQNYAKQIKQTRRRDLSWQKVEEARDGVNKNQGNQSFVHKQKLSILEERISSKAANQKKVNISKLDREETKTMKTSVQLKMPEINKCRFPQLPSKSLERKSKKSEIDQERNRSFAPGDYLSKERPQINNQNFDQTSPMVAQKASKFNSGSTNDTYGSTIKKKARNRSAKKNSPYTQKLNYFTQLPDKLKIISEEPPMLIGLNSLGKLYGKNTISEEQIQTSRKVVETIMKNGQVQEKGTIVRVKQAKEVTQAQQNITNIIKNLKINKPTNIYLSSGVLDLGEILKIIIKYKKNQTIVEFQKEKIINKEQID